MLSKTSTRLRYDKENVNNYSWVGGRKFGTVKPGVVRRQAESLPPTTKADTHIKDTHLNNKSQKLVQQILRIQKLDFGTVKPSNARL